MTSPAITIRHETPADIDAIREVNELAFGGPDEAAIVAALRANGNAIISLVGDFDDLVAGHVMFSPLYVASAETTIASIALGPLAVTPALQGQGVGTALVRAGLEECRALGYGAVFVLGHKTYYPRFGFSPARPHGVIYEDGRDSFMVVELTTGALDGIKGTARYGPEFNLTSAV